MTLFEECIAVLQKYSIIEDKELESQILSNLHLTFYGKVDFSAYDDSHEVSLDEIRLMAGEREYYIVWSDCTIPIIRCSIIEILNNIDDVLAVSFDTWLISVDMKHIIEFYHEGNITSGNIL